MNKIYTPDQTTEISLPLYMASIEAGFPSPADDYVESSLDLSQHLIKINGSNNTTDMAFDMWDIVINVPHKV